MAYSKQTWVTGETITASKLNHMEDGIDAISANGAIGTSNLANASVTNAKLDQGAVDSSNIANGAVGTTEIQDGAVTTAKLAANAVTSAKIANNSITEDELADGAVVTAKIEDGAVTSAKIATAAVSGTQIADETITATNIADETLTEAKLDPTFAATLAKVDGSYEGLTSGNTLQIVSTVGVEDNAPYNFRTTGGSADVGDRMNLKAVVGGTVAWNQLAKNDTPPTSRGGVTITGGDGYFIMDGTTTSDQSASGWFGLSSTSVHFANHVVFESFKLISGTVTGNIIFKADGGYSNVVLGQERFDRRSAENVNSLLYWTSGTVFDNAKLRVQVFDLTAMFGSSIADYAYTLESGTAGAGIAWLKKYGYFTKPYYPYAAALESVKTSAHKTIGFNQWDEEWEVGNLNGSGQPTIDNTTIRSKNFCRCVPNTSYYVRSSKTDGGSQNRYYLKILWYDADENFISGSWENNRTVTSPASAAYFKIHTNTSTVVYGNTYLHDICINLHWDGERDGEYEPYEQHTYALDDVELRGIPKKDANNNLYYDGDRYLPDGTVERRYGIRAYASGDESLADAITDGTNTVYKLTTPTTESADAYTELQICSDWGVEEFVDAATRDFDMPVCASAIYQPNLRAKLEMAPNSPSNGNGDYIVRQTDGANEYVLFSTVKELPDMPDTDGTYVLKCTVADGTATLSWVSE